MRSEVLPAYAGMIRGARSPESPAMSAPRVCGDDPLEAEFTGVGGPCSPRMRG